MVISELLSLGRTYPLIGIIIALVLFIIGFKFAKKIFWILAIIALIVGIAMVFL